MTKKRKHKDRLFKYRAFSNKTLDILVGDQLFFADPTTFNDPLDTKPTLATDMDSNELASILSELVRQRVTAEMTAAANVIKYRGPKTVDHIALLSRRRADQVIAEIRYSATDPEYEVEDPEKILFGQYIEEELLRRYDKGVVSLAERSDCPLLWSHYGDQHRGICVGYSIPERAKAELHKIRYGGSRLIAASTIAAVLSGDESAQRELDKAVLAKKATAWRYEKEWRLIGPRGAQNSPLELEEIVFGMRCADSVRYTVVQALKTRGRPVKFYEIREQSGRFILGKYSLDCDELTHWYPRRSLDLHDAFASVSLPK